MDIITNQFDDKVISYIQGIAREGMQNAAVGFSGILGQRLTVTEPSFRVVPYAQVPNILGGPESEAVGIYLKAEGSIPAQIMLMLPFQKAFDLVDLLLDQKPGTTVQLGTLEKSALGEVGNMTATFFINSIAEITHLEVRPTPPFVMVDMVGAILDVIVATSGEVSENVLMLQAAFRLDDREVQADFWVIPDQSIVDRFTSRH
jgi:chemotaxis protein CheC